MSPNLKVVHISTHGKRGGAGQAAWRLHTALRRRQIESTVVGFNLPESGPDLVSIPATTGIAANRAAAFRDIFVTGNRTAVSNTFFSSGLEGVNLAQHPAVQSADIIHLHWIGGFVRTPHLAELFALGKTIVWTLHDISPFTGGCHYSAGCTGYLAGCTHCPQLRALSDRLAAAQIADKLVLWDGVRFGLIALNQWMAGLARSAPALKHSDIATIPNGIDLNLFHPEKRAAQREKWGFPSGTTVVLFASENLAEIRKGAAVLGAALSLLAKSPFIAHAVREGRLVFLAAGSGSFPACDLPVSSLGSASEETMAEYYAGADLFVLPSQEDNQPNTVVESLASGTPVLAFAVGGVPEIVQQDVTGRLVAQVTPAAFARELLELLSHPESLGQMRADCRNYALASFDADANAQAVLDYYRRIFTVQPQRRPSNYGDFPGPVLAEFLETPSPEILGRSPSEFLDQTISLSDRTEADRYATTSAAQAAYIAVLEKERARLTNEAQDETTKSQLARMIATAEEQARYILLLEQERDSARILVAREKQESDRHLALRQAEVDRLKSQVDELAATSRSQQEYIVALQTERDRLNDLSKNLARDCEHYLQVMTEQRAYIAMLEAERAGHRA